MKDFRIGNDLKTRKKVVYDNVTNHLNIKFDTIVLLENGF